MTEVIFSPPHYIEGRKYEPGEHYRTLLAQFLEAEVVVHSTFHHEGRDYAVVRHRAGNEDHFHVRLFEHLTPTESPSTQPPQ